MKAIGNPEGEHVLACELVATKLAKWFGLSTFDFSLVDVTDVDEIPLGNGEYAKPGPAFITRKEKGGTWGGAERELKKLVNPEDLTRLVIFDTWTRNCDRRSPDGKRTKYENVFFSEAPKSKLRVIAMDHTHCFTCGRELTAKLSNIGNVRDTKIYGLFPEFQPFLDRDAARQAVSDLHKITNECVEEIVQSIPREWEVGKPARNALVEFIVRRATYVRDTIEERLWPSKRIWVLRGIGRINMKPCKGYYSIIQYCPDLARLEAANIGVVLFCPEKHFLQARTSSDNARVRHFFGSEKHDWKLISSFKKGIEERLAKAQNEIRTLEDWRHFIALRANAIQITDPRPMKVGDPQADLEELFRELVDRTRRGEQTSSLKQYLAKQFHEAGVESKLRKDVEVSVPVFNRVANLPYGYQNGRFQLIQPARFENRDAAIQSACRYAVEGRSLYEHADVELGSLQLTIVGRFRDKQNETQTHVRRILDEHEVRLFSSQQLSLLIEEIRQAPEQAKD